MKCKIFSIILILMFVTACKAQNTILTKDTTNISPSLSVSEIKYIYHEAVRRLLYQKVSILVLDNLYDFYSDERINGNSQSFDILVSDKFNNIWLNKYLDTNNVKYVVSSNEILLSMSFNFQPKIYFSKIENDYIDNFPKGIVGFIEFSNIVQNQDGNYFINGIVNYKMLLDFEFEIWSGIIYTFEIERCSSGFLRFKKVIVGDGKEVPSSLGPISSIFELTDTEKCR